MESATASTEATIVFLLVSLRQSEFDVSHTPINKKNPSFRLLQLHELMNSSTERGLKQNFAYLRIANTKERLTPKQKMGSMKKNYPYKYKQRQIRASGKKCENINH
jgi:hypothetical protein